MSDDPHAPTNAGPDPQEAAATEPEPTPVVPPSEADWRTPPGSAAPAQTAGGRPEVEVGMAFAGGVAAALLLKVLTR